MKKGIRYRQLTYEERIKIALLKEQGESLRSIARVLGRSPNTIARELQEKVVRGQYVPQKAQRKTYWRRYVSKRNCLKVAMNKDLAILVGEKLPLGWSPERIAGYAFRLGLPVSKKAIYKYVKSRCLERHLFWRRNQKKSGPKRSRLAWRDRGKRPLSFRPPLASSGHYELDFIVSRKSPAVLLVLVDRFTRHTTVRKLERKTPGEVLRVLAFIHRRQRIKTITTDNDIVFRKWRKLEASLSGVYFYFCCPYHSWEKGLVENTNRWIRVFIPKRRDLATVSGDELRSIHIYLNETPRQCLGFRTAGELLLAEQTNKRVS